FRPKLLVSGLASSLRSLVVVISLVFFLEVSSDCFPDLSPFRWRSRAKDSVLAPFPPSSAFFFPLLLLSFGFTLLGAVLASPICRTLSFWFFIPLLEQESGFYFNMKYFEDEVHNGNWDNVERYLSGFTKVDDNRYSMKIFFEIRKQKYLEALDK
ncbi:hypothetical protein GW17_00028319, partial [Ensete ventricosum]